MGTDQTLRHAVEREIRRIRTFLGHDLGTVLAWMDYDALQTELTRAVTELLQTLDPSACEHENN